jgi:cardiolipin synthase
MTPYIIIDDALSSSLENAALRGVDVRIIIPYVPDRKMVFVLTRNYAERLIASGVRIYEYRPGFVHAKAFMVDEDIAMVGTINLDYRSLAHHFEDGVYLYKSPVVAAMQKDFKETMAKSIEMSPKTIRSRPKERVEKALLQFFAPLF